MLVRRILLVLAFACLATLPPISALARTITVDDDGPADYTSVQEAITAGAGGDTVFVKAGNYHESGIILINVGLLKGEGAEVTRIVGQMDQFFSTDWSRYEETFQRSGYSPPLDRSAKNWIVRTFVVWNWGSAIEGIALGWEGEEKGVGILSYHPYVAVRRCKLIGNFAGMVLRTELAFPRGQIIQANTITGNEYGVIWDIGSMDYDMNLPGRADRNWWGTVQESEIKAGFLYTVLQYWPELESWVDEEDMFRQACYPWLDTPVVIKNFEATNEDGVHYNNIYDNEINLATPMSPKLTAISPTNWGEIKSRMR